MTKNRFNMIGFGGWVVLLDRQNINLWIFLIFEEKNIYVWNTIRGIVFKMKMIFSTIKSITLACVCINILILCVHESKCCFGRSSPYRGFGVCLNVWDWKCPYEEKCIETWKVCDGWADCISRRDEVNFLVFLISR